MHCTAGDGEVSQGLSFKDEKEGKSHVSTEDTQFAGVVIGDKNHKINESIERVENDGILLVATARINGRMFLTYLIVKLHVVLLL